MSPPAMSSMMRPLATPPRSSPPRGSGQVDPDEAERAHLLDQLGLDAGLVLALPVAGGQAAPPRSGAPCRALRAVRR